MQQQSRSKCLFSKCKQQTFLECFKCSAEINALETDKSMNGHVWYSQGHARAQDLKKARAWDWKETSVNATKAHSDQKNMHRFLHRMKFLNQRNENVVPKASGRPQWHKSSSIFWTNIAKLFGNSEFFCRNKKYYKLATLYNSVATL